MTMKLREFTTATQPMVDRLNSENWWQGSGRYTWLRPRCCIGAHLAHHFKVATADSDDFIDGYCSAARFIGCSVTQLELLLQAAGAPVDPFSSADWGREPWKVWEKLKRIEGFPPDVRKRQDAQDWVKQQRALLGIEGDHWL